MADAELDFELGRSPSAQEVLSARMAAGITQADAAASVYLSGQPRWAEYERGAKSMDAARFELFLLKHRLHPMTRARA